MSVVDTPAVVIADTDHLSVWPRSTRPAPGGDLTVGGVPPAGRRGGRRHRPRPGPPRVAGGHEPTGRRTVNQVV